MEWIVEDESLSDFIDHGKYTIHTKQLVRCRECKHHHYDSEDIPYCDRIDYGYGWEEDDFCSRGEKRTDEGSD